MSDKIIQSELVVKACGSVLADGELDLKDPDQVEAQKAIAKNTHTADVCCQHTPSYSEYLKMLEAGDRAKNA